MTRLAFTGLRNGALATFIWQDGALSGDAATVGWIQHYAGMLEGHLIGPVGGPYASSHHLANPYAAAEIIRSVFPGAVQMEGELPMRTPPEGAVQ